MTRSQRILLCSLEWTVRVTGALAFCLICIVFASWLGLL